MTNTSLDITPQQAHLDATDGSAVIVDVREPWEWEAGSAAGALRISLHELPGRLDDVPRDRRVHCICASGNRSRVAAEFLRDRGFDATSVSGGTTAWMLHRLPAERGA